MGNVLKTLASEDEVQFSDTVHRVACRLQSLCGHAMLM